MKYLLIVFLVCLGVEILAQATPSGYTTNLRLRKYSSGVDPSADSINANSDDIDAGWKEHEDTLALVKADLYNFADYNGDLQSNVVGVAQLKTDIDTSHVKTTGADIIYGERTMHSGQRFSSSIFLGATTGEYNGLGKVGSSGSGFVVYEYGGFQTDTLLSHRQMLINNNTIYGDWIFNGENTQTDVWHSGFGTATTTSATLTLNGNTNNYEIALPAGSQTITSISVTGKAQGDIIFLINTSNSNTLTLNDSSPFNLTASFVMAEDDNITLYYDGTLWVETARSNN